jgi:hypothetical protein
MKIGTIVNLMHIYQNYQNMINEDVKQLEYYKSIGSKLGIEKAQIQLDKDKARMGEFLDYEI